MAADRPDDRPLFERLQETTSGEAAVRQLRRRYDLLRTDYERLLDRLGELEHHLVEGAEEAERKQEPPAPPPPPVEPIAPSPMAAPSGDLARALSDPLRRLRAEYEAAAGSIEQIINGLGSLAAGALKGQKAPADLPPSPPMPVPMPRLVEDDAESDDEPAGVRRNHVVTVRAHGSGVPELLVFQERLAAMANVERVSIAAIDEEQATLVVELGSDPEG